MSGTSYSALKKTIAECLVYASAQKHKHICPFSVMEQQVFKEEEEAIKVDLHEGCGRTKLFWLMALADSKTMKAMVEFREHTGKELT